ncbi:hypothetical protein GQ43DRAFT_499744 [Delitschia confertaspora ATCC 74209]|uniref:Methyltransferase domain-containing protein n=1 Tax=Delitschia confertaspora ATCC 74209 TaxID=1513339 RepID=A0A9P4JG87_9PLEO|nr:hypothetical protein GQ43DRAFT_499744 [Delitschia confertaspora ATCC 74209]
MDHRITLGVRHTLEPYSNVRPEDVKRHAYAIVTWALPPWPCAGLGSLLTSTIPQLPLYTTILMKVVQSGGTLIDVGCYCGTDLRRLIFDAAPQDNLFGTDLVNQWDLGFELFRDQDKLQVKFIEVDILNPNTELEVLNGKMDVISATHFLHNWN